MAAVSLTEPLCQPCAYNSCFKVELYVKKPLMPIHLSPEQVGLEMLCLCSQLDLLIRAQVHQGQLKQDTSPAESDSFRQQGAEIIDQMNQCIEHLPKPAPLLEDYLDIAGLSVMFPRVEVYIIHGSPVDMLERPPLDGYFPHLGRLNQLLVLSQQLEDDVKHLGSHKYIAHQLAVIYYMDAADKSKSHLLYGALKCIQQVLTSLNDTLPLTPIKRDIEANFKQMKMSLMTEEGSKQEPQLPAQYISWITKLTHNITSTVSSLTEELTEELSPILAFVSRWS